MRREQQVAENARTGYMRKRSEAAYDERRMEERAALTKNVRRVYYAGTGKRTASRFLYFDKQNNVNRGTLMNRPAAASPPTQTLVGPPRQA